MTHSLVDGVNAATKERTAEVDVALHKLDVDSKLRKDRLRAQLDEWERQLNSKEEQDRREGHVPSEEVKRARAESRAAIARGRAVLAQTRHEQDPGK